MTGKCPTCGRSIEIENGRWTRHTDPESWSGRPADMRQCANAGKLADLPERPKP